MGIPIVELKRVSLKYRLARQKTPTFKEYMIHWIKGVLVYEDLWALRDVSLELYKGDMIGIVGRNGAGKSTLLKVIAKILNPTSGECIVRGRVSPLLELGIGFDMELSGYENIYLAGLFLGHTKKEIATKIDEIVEFAELEYFINSPVRNYSSGMVARLGFAIATAWRPEILIVDEILSVGDLAFGKKCIERIKEFRSQGTTILLVSHAGNIVEELCNKAVWLEKGIVYAAGDTEEVIEKYYNFIKSITNEECRREAIFARQAL